MHLVTPGLAHADSYLDALQRGWSPDTLRPGLGAADARRLQTDPAAFLASLDDRQGGGAPIQLPDGTTAQRIPGFRLWMWDGQFCGSIGLRWQPGTVDLPPHCLGHIGYNVVGWKRRRGYATSALRQMLPHARAMGLPYVELITALENVGSQRVIAANGGVLVERLDKLPSHGGGPGLRFRIALDHVPINHD
jgi:predicted acetyltransferase